MDHEIAARMGSVMLGIETAEVDYFVGVQQLNALVKELKTIPGAWKDTLLELCSDLELVAGDEHQVAAIMERIEKAISLIGDRAA